MKNRSRILSLACFFLLVLMAMAWISAAAENNVIYESSFLAGVDGWFARGVKKVFQTENATLRIEGRKEDWHSPGRNFELIAGNEYEVSVKIYQDQEKDADFIISLERSDAAGTGWDRLVFGKVKNGEWTTLRGRFIPKYYDSYVLYVETDGKNKLSYEIRNFRLESTNGIPELKVAEYSTGKKSTQRFLYELETDPEGKQYAVILGGSVKKDLAIPSEIDGYPVRKVGFDVLYSNSAAQKIIKSLTIETGIKELENGAFKGCEALTSVILPEGLEKIGEGAFDGCPITKITLPSTVVSIGKEAFRGHKLKEIVLPDNVQYIGTNAFYDPKDKCPVKVTIRNRTIEPEKGVFGYLNPSYSKNTEEWIDNYADDPSVKAHTIEFFCYPGSTTDQLYKYNVTKSYLDPGPDGIRTASADPILKAGTYMPEETISELIIPEGVEEIEDYALAGLRSLCKIQIPSTMKRIGSHAFEGCTALQEIILPKTGVVSVGEAAFKDCISITKINLENGITEIPDALFDNCRKLSKVTLPKSGLVRIGVNAFRNCTGLSNLNLPEGLEEIGESAFEGAGIKNLKLPNTVTKLGKRAFYASGIVSLILPKSLEEIPEQLCLKAEKLKSVSLPRALKKIGKSAFAYCPLSSLNLPEGLTTIGEYAFMQDITAIRDSYRYSRGKKTVASLKSVKLPASLQIIEKGAFMCNDALTTVSFARKAKLSEIGESAFSMCVHLKQITLPDSLRIISNEAFAYCQEMKKADLGHGVLEIRDGAFRNNALLVSFTVPDTVETIGKDILKDHSWKLIVICKKDSAIEAYVEENYPKATIKISKSK